LDVAIIKTAFCSIANINILRYEPSTYIFSKFPAFNSRIALSAIHKIVAVVAATCNSSISGGSIEIIGNPSIETIAATFTLGIVLINFFNILSSDL